MDVFQINPATGGLSYQVTQNTPGVAHDVAASELYAYVADEPGYLRVADVLSDVAARRSRWALTGRWAMPWGWLPAVASPM